MEETDTVRSSASPEERAFLETHLSYKLVTASQNPASNSKREIQKAATRSHPTEPAASFLRGDSRHTDGSVCFCAGRSLVRRKGMDGNAKDIQVTFHNAEGIPNKCVSRKTD